MSNGPERITLAMTGASGAQYGLRLLDCLVREEREVLFRGVKPIVHRLIVRRHPAEFPGRAFSMMKRMAVAFHSRFDKALPVNQCLGVLHRLGMGRCGPWIVQRFLYLRPEPGVIGIRISGQSGRQAAFCGHAGQKNTHRVGERQTDARKCVRSLCFQLIVNTDMKHGCLGRHGWSSS